MPKSLGRGLSSLIPNNKSKKQEDAEEIINQPTLWLKDANLEILEVSPQEISANPHQPRKNFSAESLQDLMESIKEHGILQPLIVIEVKGDPSTSSTSSGQAALKASKYELIAGERRLRASQNLRLKTVPVIVRTAGELEKLELSLIENIQRQDLNAVERALAYKKLIDEFSLTHEQAAKRMGKSRPVISNTLRLLDLPGEVQKMISDDRLSDSLALAVLEIKGQDKQIELARQIAEQKLTKTETHRLIRQSESRKFSGDRHKRDPLIRGFEKELEELLQTRIKIGRRGKAGYMIEIEAYSKEELENLVSKILN